MILAGKNSNQTKLLLLLGLEPSFEEYGVVNLSWSKKVDECMMINAILEGGCMML